MIAIHHRMTALEASHATMEATIRTLQGMRIWIIADVLISILNSILRLLPLPARDATTTPLQPAPPSSNSNSLHIGTTPPAPASHAEWLTTEEVAARERRAPRTILTWIAEGRIQPPPVQSDRSWRISPGYTLTAADSRYQPPITAAAAAAE